MPTKKVICKICIAFRFTSNPHGWSSGCCHPYLLRGRIVLPTQHVQDSKGQNAKCSHSKHTISIAQEKVTESLSQNLNFWSVFVPITWVRDMIGFSINKENALLKARTT